MQQITKSLLSIELGLAVILIRLLGLGDGLLILLCLNLLFYGFGTLISFRGMWKW